MNGKKIFCEDCRRDVEYEVTSIKRNEILKGEEYEYIGKEAICKECHSELFVAEVEDENLELLYNSYRKKNDLISMEKLVDIPKKYNIGKRPLSLLLGWGEMTFSRYYDGYLPTKQYSDILKKIYDEPSYYFEILETNKDNLKSQLSYEKSKRAVNEVLGEIDYTESKIDLVIRYLLYRCEDVTPLALQKILYYVQGFYYAFEEEFVFEEDCEAWVHGPVYRDIYYRYSNYRFDPIDGVAEFDESVFITPEKAILDSIIKNLCCFSGKTLEKLTHMELPWLKTRDGLPIDAHSNDIITKDLIGKYFCAVKKKFCMLTPGDIEVYVNKIFNQIN